MPNCNNCGEDNRAYEERCHKCGSDLATEAGRSSEEDSMQRVARPEPEREYEPYGDEWRKALMKMPKTVLIDILKTECMHNRDISGPSD